METIDRPWYGNYCIELCCTDYKGDKYRHPVTWDCRPNHWFWDLYDSLMNKFLTGKSEDMPVIVDYTGMRQQKLPEKYNHVVMEGDLSTL